jgi:hypothetical protein
MTCRKCHLEKPAEEFPNGKRTCRMCAAADPRRRPSTSVARERQRTAERPILEDGDEVDAIPRELPREDAASSAVYLKSETFHHARCNRPLFVVGYRPSSEEIHFRCQPCRESVFLPTVAVERLITR